ncbi:GNAT superfamily N-acetyltransferase [Psychromicrobium silvestre]|uniref:GNAT superfamily N-acetyltransferase n=1 Tax=Psychromicrobium silvestre TaxID=1645614 RepID=A0A7Y9LTZ2_9MICC|nr:GNAT family N-acetyltransferase [Psychromicrobium silvestre]NYE95574.1 GNAT superfamily N-acetyltransferase [Psychromicrobium silvestre]
MDYEISDDPARINLEAIWQFLSTEAYWGRQRSREEVERQITGAWRVVGAYRAGGNELVGFARAVSDGVGFGYLADVFVHPEHRGHSLGKRIVSKMIDEGPGATFRWTLFTADAHGLYRQFGFVEPDGSAMVRPASAMS